MSKHKHSNFAIKCNNVWLPCDGYDNCDFLIKQHSQINLYNVSTQLSLRGMNCISV